MRAPLIALFFVALLFVGRAAHAQGLAEGAEAQVPGSSLTIALLTIGPGDHPFFKFGHDALLVHDESTHEDLVYNYGTFAFNSPWLIVDFLRGRFQYWLSVQALDRVLLHYARENRSIVAQELALTPDQARKVAEFVRWNARDENKYYKYDYYRDNCATRLRDVIDQAVDGRLRAAATGPASMTFRAHTLRLTADNLPVYLGLDVAMGDVIDQPITVWEEMFLPAKVEETLRAVRVPSPRGEIPLVLREHSILAAKRAPLRTAPPAWTFRMFLVGLVLGGTFAGLGYLARKTRAARWFLGAYLATFGLVVGLLGCLFVGLWAFTDHHVAYHNENILQCAPFAVVLVWLGWGVATASAPRLLTARRVVMAGAALSAFGLILKALPYFDQDNVRIMALLLPAWLGALWGVARFTASAPATG